MVYIVVECLVGIGESWVGCSGLGEEGSMGDSMEEAVVVVDGCMCGRVVVGFGCGGRLVLGMEYEVVGSGNTAVGCGKGESASSPPCDVLPHAGDSQSSAPHPHIQVGLVAASS